MPPDECRQINRYRVLTKTIVWSIIIHALALLAMALVIGPGLDTTSTVLARATWVSENPTLWRLGWLPWQLTALSDLAVSAALLAYLSSVPDRPGAGWAGFAMLFTILAVIPDQWGEAVFISSYLDLARSTVASQSPESYLGVEAWGLRATGVWGAGGYTLMAVGWFMASAQCAGGIGRHRLYSAATLVMLLLFSITVGLTWHATTNASSPQQHRKCCLPELARSRRSSPAPCPGATGSRWERW